MKYRNDLINNKVLIIHSYFSKMYRHYCTYHICIIKHYIPSINLIIVGCSDINRSRFTLILIDHDDPFIKDDYCSKEIAYNYSLNDGGYYILNTNEAEKQLNKDLIHYRKKTFYSAGSKLVKTDGILLTSKERKTLFEHLLKELKDESI